jgi:hypothetical protein
MPFVGLLSQGSFSKEGVAEMLETKHWAHEQPIAGIQPYDYT